MTTILRKINIFKLFLILTFLIFPFGQILKFNTYNGLKISVLDVLVGIMVAIGLSKKGMFLKSWDKPLVKLPGLLFIIFALVSLLISSVRVSLNTTFLGFAYLFRFSVYFLFYLLIFEVCQQQKSRIKIRNLVDLGLATSGFLVAIIGIFQYLLYPDLRNLMYLGWDPHYFRLFSTFFDPNFTGIILVLTLFQFIFFYPQKGRLRTKSFYTAAILIISLAIYLTRSRSAYLSLLFGFLILLIRTRNVKKEIIGVVILIFLIFQFIPKPKVDVFDFFRSTSSIARVNNWRQSLQLGLKFPVFGHGFGTLKFPDSSFLYVFSTTGLSGLFLYSWMWKRIFVFGFFKNTKVLVVASTLFISSWFNNTLFYPWIWYWFLLFMGRQEVKVR